VGLTWSSTKRETDADGFSFKQNREGKNLPNKSKDATNRYLGWLGVACLIILPFIGPGAIVIWALTAMTLYGITASLMRQPPPDPLSKSPCSRKRSQRKHRRRYRSRRKPRRR